MGEKIRVLDDDGNWIEIGESTDKVEWHDLGQENDREGDGSGREAHEGGEGHGQGQEQNDGDDDGEGQDEGQQEGEGDKKDFNPEDREIDQEGMNSLQDMIDKIQSMSDEEVYDMIDEQEENLDSEDSPYDRDDLEDMLDQMNLPSIPIPPPPVVEWVVSVITPSRGEKEKYQSCFWGYRDGREPYDAARLFVDGDSRGARKIRKEPYALVVVTKRPEVNHPPYKTHIFEAEWDAFENKVNLNPFF